MYKGNTGVAFKGISSTAKALDGKIGWDEAATDVAGAYIKGAVVDTASTAVIGSVGSAVTSTAVGSALAGSCLLYTSPSPRDLSTSRMPSSA